MTTAGITEAMGLLTTARAALQRLTEIPSSTLARDDVETLTAEVYRYANQIEATKLQFLRTLDEKADRHDVVAFLTTSPRNLTHSQAERDVDAARLTDPTTPWDGAIGGLDGDRGALQMVGRKLAAGDVSRAHLDVFHSTWKSLPTPVRRGTLSLTVETDTGELIPTSQPNARILDAFFATTAADQAPGLVKRLTDDMLEMLDPLRSERGREPDTEARRSLTRKKINGITRYTIDATDEDAPFIDQAVTAHAAPEPADDTGPDQRSREQRRYDAFVEVLHLGVDNSDGAVAQQSTVLVHTTIAEAVAARDAGSPVADGHGPLRDDVFRFMTCNADLRTLLFDSDGTPLSLETTARAATQHQRQALAARDRGCIAPGCGKPAWASHAHHVRFWADGGPTTVENMVLLCGRHHRQLHQGRLEVRFAEDGRPQARWVNGLITGPWRRNTFHDLLIESRTLARRLRDSCAPPG
jgi:hypothetical protein